MENWCWSYWLTAAWNGPRSSTLSADHPDWSQPLPLTQHHFRPCFHHLLFLARGRKGRMVLLSHVLKCFYKHGLLKGSKLKRSENSSVHLTRPPLFYKWGNGDLFLWAESWQGVGFVIFRLAHRTRRARECWVSHQSSGKGLKVGSDRRQPLPSPTCQKMGRLLNSSFLVDIWRETGLWLWNIMIEGQECSQLEGTPWVPGPN